MKNNLCFLLVLIAVSLSCDSSGSIDIQEDNPWETVQINGQTYTLSSDDVRPDLSIQIPYNRKEGNIVISNLVFINERGFAVDCVGDSLINQYFDFSQ